MLVFKHIIFEFLDLNYLNFFKICNNSKVSQQQHHMQMLQQQQHQQLLANRTSFSNQPTQITTVTARADNLSLSSIPIKRARVDEDDYD